jgi:hypothetical protein
MTEKNQTAIPKSKVEDALREFEEYFLEEVDKIRTRLHRGSISASATARYYMKGHAFGLEEMGKAAIEFFRKRLTGDS